MFYDSVKIHTKVSILISKTKMSRVFKLRSIFNASTLNRSLKALLNNNRLAYVLKCICLKRGKEDFV